MMNKSNAEDYDLEYIQQIIDFAAEGNRVFPGRADTKVPCIAGWQELATTDPVQIARWWALEFPGAVVLRLEDRFMIDVDNHPDSDPPVNGYVSLGKILKISSAVAHAFKNTPAEMTQSGSIHFFFANDLPNFVQTAGKHWSGIDYRVQGKGYARTWPSPGIKRTNPLPISERAMLPDEFFDEIHRIEAEQQREKDARYEAYRAAAIASSEPFDPFWDDDGEPILTNRNDTLFSYGRKLRARGADDDTIYEKLHEANNSRCVIPLDDDEIQLLTKSVCAKPAGRGNVGFRTPHYIRTGFKLS